MNWNRSMGGGKLLRPNHRRKSACRSFRVESLENRCLLSDYFVASTGSDTNPGTLDQPFRTVQRALQVASQPGDNVSVRAGTYREKVSFPSSGSAAGSITLQAFPGDRPVLSGQRVRGPNMVLMENVSYVRITGFEIANNTKVKDGSGVRVIGAGSHIEITNNLIHDMRGKNAMGITVYGTSTTTPISDLLIDGNEIFNCQPAPSEALTLNGNVTDFVVSNNVVHDVNNIGIDLIGGEADINPTQVVRNGIVRGNTVYRARSKYGGGYAAGIYVDGGRDIVIENNVSYQNDLGLEIGAENQGTVASGIIVRNNLIYENDKAGIVFGGYDVNTGRVRNSSFINNTVFQNDTRNVGFGQLWIQYADTNIVTNNIFVAAANNVLLYSEKGNVDNTLNHNLWFTAAGESGAQFTWNDRNFGSFAAYRAATAQDIQSIFGAPLFGDAAARNFQLTAASPAIDTGTEEPGRFAPTDFNGTARPQGAKPDIGAFELLNL